MLTVADLKRIVAAIPAENDTLDFVLDIDSWADEERKPYQMGGTLWWLA